VLTNRIYRKIVKISILPIILNMILAFPGGALGNDTDIYAAGATLKPMVMILIDNSGSMDEGLPYDSGSTYAGSYNPSTVYRYNCTRWRRGVCVAGNWTAYAGTFTDVINRDPGVDTPGQDGIDDNNASVMLGNRLNFDNTPTSRKIDVAKSVLNNIVTLMYDQVDFGFMKLNRDDGGNVINKIGATETSMHGQISAINANTWTPLAEALTDVGRYFEDTYIGQYSPWTDDNWCQKGFVIIMTDGAPTYDTDRNILSHFLERYHAEDNLPNRPIPSPLPSGSNRGYYWDQNSDYNRNSSTVTDPLNNDVWVADDTYSDDVPQTFLDDVARYLYRHDLRPDIDGTNNLTTYTIGFTHTSPLLEKTAQEGGGLYFTANNAEQLERALLSALDDIAKKLQTYTAPVVPVTRTSSGDRMYLAFFKPLTFSKFWPGDVQKYGLSGSNQIVDRNGNPATDAAGAMLDTAVPYWSASALLKARTSPRNIYTYFGTTPVLSDANNRFDTSNTYLSAAVLGNPAKISTADSATSARDDLISYLHGYDAYNEEGNGYAAKREYVLGDILHSVPLVLDYAGAYAADPNRYIYFGSNDGMIHCLRDSDGEEMWAFIPPDALPRLKQFQEGTTHPLFCDGTIRVYEERTTSGTITRAVIVFGERGGGNSYYAIDVTDPSDPRFLWRINSSTSGFSELGQTWSEPIVAPVKMNNAGVETTYKAIIFGAGFDSAQADNPAVLAASAGRGVFIADVLTGSLLKSFTSAATTTVPNNLNVAGMLYSIPSAVLAVDKSADGYVDRIYVGDLGGNLWRIGAPNGKDNLIDNWIVRKQFATNPGADGSTGRKIYYPPDIGFENTFDIVLFGTGDRDNPRATTTVDRVYGVKDFNQLTGFTTLTESSAGMENRTNTPFASATVPALGWYFRLVNTGEKMLATPLLFNKYLLATTFSPNNGVCSVGGDAKLYAVNYLLGTYTYYTLGVGIPTEVVLVVRSIGTTAFVGAGGGVINVAGLNPDGTSPNQTPISEVLNLNTGIIPISWREVF